MGSGMAISCATRRLGAGGFTARDGFVQRCRSIIPSNRLVCRNVRTGEPAVVGRLRHAPGGAGGSGGPGGEISCGFKGAARAGPVSACPRAVSGGSFRVPLNSLQINALVDTDAAVRQNSRLPFGGVPERSKGSDCKSDGSAFGGSNPPPSTTSVSAQRADRRGRNEWAG